MQLDIWIPELKLALEYQGTEKILISFIIIIIIVIIIIYLLR